MESTQYVNHVYGRGNRTITQASVECEPQAWTFGAWLADRPGRGEHLFASSAAQQIIWRHQHPETCDDKKFLIYASDGPSGHGIGSTLHVATWALATALELNRILLFAPTPNGPWTQGKFCLGFTNLHECYFETTSTCKYADVVNAMSLSAVPELNQSTQQKHHKLIKCDVDFQMTDVTLVPPALKALHAHSPVPDERVYFWFRAQAVAFLVRPNTRTLEEVYQRKRKQSWSGIPAGAVSVHIRHGDKYKEMQLVPDADYLSRAEELLLQYPDLKKIMFLSTEDPSSVAYFKSLQDWTVLSVDVLRPNDTVYSPTDFAAKIGADEEMLNSLLNLDLALDCSAWVGTIKSNWNRLIEELRSTVRCKAHLPYIDAYSGWDISDYLW